MRIPNSSKENGVCLPYSSLHGSPMLSIRAPPDQPEAMYVDRPDKSSPRTDHGNLGDR